MANAKIITVPASGSDIAAPPTEITDNLDPAVLIESSDGKDYLEIDTTDSAEKLILGLGGADILLRTDGSDMGYYSYGNRHLSMVGGFRIEPVAGTTEFLQHPAASLDPMWSTGRHIRFRLTGTDKAFKVENSGGTVRLWVSENGKITTGNEETPLCDAGGIHILGSAGTSNGGLDPGARLLVLEDNSSDGAGMSIVSDTSRKCAINFVDTHRRGWVHYYHNLDSFRIGAGGTDGVLRINSKGLAVNSASDPSVTLLAKGSLTTNLSDSTSVISDGTTGTNRNVASTGHGLKVGQAVKIDSTVYTVAALGPDSSAAADNFLLDSDHGSTGDKGQATTDPRLLEVQTGDASVVFNVEPDGAVGIGETTPLGKLHVKTADSGQGSVLSYADELVVEGSASSGISVLSGNANTGYLVFADSGSTHQASVNYNHSTNKMGFYINGATWFDIDADGNQTHTLDDTDNSVFKVVDNKGSPITYLSLTQDGICQIGHTGGQTKLFAGELTLMPSNYLTQSQGYPKLNKLNTTDGGATTATINLFLQRSGPGQSHYVNPTSSSQVYTFSLRDKNDTGTESSNGNWSYGEFTFQFHNVGSAACTVKTSTPNGTVKAVDASGASIGACDGTGFSVAANTTIGFRITKFNAKHTGATNAFNVFFIETLWTAANS